MRLHHTLVQRWRSDDDNHDVTIAILISSTRRSGSSCSDYSKEGDTTKKAKIGITIKVMMRIMRIMMTVMRIIVIYLKNVTSLKSAKFRGTQTDENKMRRRDLWATIDYCLFQKSPNSDRTFESRLLDSEFEDQTPTPIIKNKMLDLKVTFCNYLSWKNKKLVFYYVLCRI